MLAVKPKGVAFDWDGTLAHTRKAVVEAMEHVLAHYGREPWDVTKAKYRDTAKSLKENFPNFFGDSAKEAYEMYLDYYRSRSYAHVTRAAGAQELLQKLSASDILVCVISNKEKSLLLAEVKHCFPDIEFYKIFGDGDAERNKPAPDPVFKAFADASFAINRENVWLVGDSKQDSECAYSSGCLPLIVGKFKFADEAYIREKTNSSEPLYLFQSLEELSADIGREK